MVQIPSTPKSAHRITDAAIETSGPPPPPSRTEPPSASAPAPAGQERLTPGNIGGLTLFQPSKIDISSVNMLIYGGSGAGKTHFAGTASQVESLCPVLFLDIEGGSLTLRGIFEDGKIDIANVPSWPKLQAVYNELYKGRHPYRTVVIDSISECQKLAMLHALEGTRSKLPGSPDPIDFDTDKLPEIKDWHRNSEQMRRFIRGFRDLPVNTIFTALEMDKEVGNISTKWPLFTNKLSEEIPGLVSTVFYLYVKETKGTEPNARHLLTDKTARVLAKSRIHGLPMVIDNPTMSDVHAQLMK